MKKSLLFVFLFVIIAVMCNAQDMASQIDTQMLLEKIGANASTTYDCRNYKTNLLNIYIDSFVLTATDSIKIQVEASYDNATYTPITALNLVNGVVDASGTVKIYTATSTPHVDEIQLIGAKYYKVKTVYNENASATLSIFTLKSGKIIGH